MAIAASAKVSESQSRELGLGAFGFAKLWANTRLFARGKAIGSGSFGGKPNVGRVYTVTSQMLLGKNPGEPADTSPGPFSPCGL